jgi:energy-coupling factor transporter transmembrane protein EcfT
MEDIIERILSHPLLIVTLSLVCLLLIFAILKRLLKMVLISFLILGLYFGYVYYFQEEYPLPKVDMKGVDQIKEDLQKWMPKDLNVSSFLDANRSRITD